MPTTHTSLHYHLVFSTKDREPWIAPSLRDRVHEYIGGTVRGLEGVAHAVGGVGDHVHVLAGLRAIHRLADVMREIKSESSAWMHREAGLSGFAWQTGYGGFTVSPSHLENVRRYVLGQAEHHQNTTFQEEYVSMLERGLVVYDERFLW